MAVTSHEIVECRGNGGERGRAHGEALRGPIHSLLERWDASAAARTGRPPHALVSGLVETTGFVAAIERHTPDLLDEVRGIAEGSNVGFDRILALNLMDEEWWFAAPAEPRGACTLIAVGPTDGRPSVLAQNMDLPERMDGAQAIVRYDDGKGNGGTVLTAAGMVGLTGVSSAGLGVCVNTLSMLNHSRDGVPVAFVMRAALTQGSVARASEFLSRVPHASGQHYALADPTDVAGYECSAAGAVRSDPDNGRLCHTNHPLRSTDLDPAVPAEGRRDSHVRFAAIEAAAPEVTTGADCERALADREAPLCVVAEPGHPWLTFGSIWAELGASPRVRIAPGPPDRTAWLDASPA